VFKLQFDANQQPVRHLNATSKALSTVAAIEICINKCHEHLVTTQHQRVGNMCNESLMPSHQEVGFLCINLKVAHAKLETSNQQLVHIHSSGK
jgi:hypothetical protein